MKTLGKWLLRGMIAVFIVLALLVAGLYAIRTWLLPDLTVLQPRIEAQLSETLKQPVRLQGLSAAWNWVSVDIKLSDLSIGPEDAPVLQARNLNTTLNAYPLLWKTVSTQSLSADYLRITAVQSGSKIAPKWFIAGVDAAAPSDGAAMRWALNQPSVSIAALDIDAQDAAAHWIPESKLRIQLANLALKNAGLSHALSAQFAPSYDDPRLGNAVQLDTTFKHALTGDAAQPKNWAGIANVTVPKAHLGRSAAWLLNVLDADAKPTAQTTAWSRWAKQSLAQALVKNTSTVTFGQGALSATGQSAFTGLGKTNTAFSAPIDWRWQRSSGADTHALQATTASLALAPLSNFLQTMPLPAAVNSALAQASAQGNLAALKASAVMGQQGLQSSEFSATASQLALQQFDWQGTKGTVNVPTIHGISGALKMRHTPAQTDTQLTLDSTKGFIDLPRLFESPRIEFDALTGAIDLKLTAQKTEVSLSQLRFKNADVDGQIKGQYSIATNRAAGDTSLGVAQLSGSFDRADLTQLHRYMPASMSRDARDWLQHTVAQGQASELQFTLNGELSRFPFLPATAQAGERFDLRASIDDAVLNFNPQAKPDAVQTPQTSKPSAKPWPLIKQVNGQLQLNGLSLSLLNMSGQIQALGAEPDALPLPARVPKLTIASLTQPIVVFQTRVVAPAASVLALVRATPLSQSFADQIAVLKATGAVDVDANLTLDIAQPEKNLTQGTFKLDNGSLLFSKDLPPLEQMNTTLSFKQSALKVEQANAQWLGGTIHVTGGYDTQDPSQTLNAQGTAQLAAFKQLSQNAMAQALLSHAVGAVDYTVKLNAKPEGFAWQLFADLKETALSWPGLLNKPAGVPLPFTLTRSPTQRSANTGLGNIITEDVWEASLGATVLGPFKGSLERRLDGDVWQMTRSAVALGEQAELNPPFQGLGIHITAGKVNLDALRKEIEALPWASVPVDKPNVNATANSAQPAWMPRVLALQVEDLTVANRRFYDVVGVASRSGSRGQVWDANVSAKGINGYINWTDNSRTEGLGGGQLTIKLSELTIPASEVQNAKQELLAITPKQVPSVELTIDKLTVGNTFFGALSAKASNLALNDRVGWEIDRFSVELPHTKLSGKGAWKHPLGSEQGEVALELDLNTSNLGTALESFGLGKVVAAAPGTIKGNIAWNGTPFGLDIPSLSGSLNAEFAKGQFLKVDPGAGRLVGLFSLQSLPRRLTLDFKDMFGTGFAFDTIKATATIEKGLLKTDDFAMQSSAAQVSASGEVALAAETQNLNFVVKPNFDAGSVSVLYMLINPPIGLATLAAQFLLREPLRQSLSVEYAITGSWANPDVKQVKREIK